MPTTTLQMLSTVRDDATVTISLEQTELRSPDTFEVLVRMVAAPINPSDLGNMFAGADLSSLSAGRRMAEADSIAASLVQESARRLPGVRHGIRKTGRA